MTDEPRTCSEPGCDRQREARGLCPRHYAVDYRRRRRANAGHRLTRGQPVQAAAEWVLPCPDPLVPLAAQAAELDARAIVRVIWPHLLEAHLAGLPPFTRPGPRP